MIFGIKDCFGYAGVSFLPHEVRGSPVVSRRGLSDHLTSSVTEPKFTCINTFFRYSILISNSRPRISIRAGNLLYLINTRNAIKAIAATTKNADWRSPRIPTDVLSEFLTPVDCVW